MRLIGMLDSPYVRRVAISLDLLGVSFQHQALSVFSDFQQFQTQNPVVKAPTLVFDDGRVLMDSSLILEYFEGLSDSSLWSRDVEVRRHEFRAVSYALAACEKSVQTVYEQNLRPRDLQFSGWLERISGQRSAAFFALDAEIANLPRLFLGLNQAAISSAVAYQFAHSELEEDVNSSKYPRLAEHAKRVEGSEVFLKYPPLGPGVQAQS
jgi:glutathione S-transferase